MSTAYVSRELRRRIATQARHRCGYCLAQERITGMPMEIDHLWPESQGGLTNEENLWLACTLCNDHKGDRTDGLDPLSGTLTPLFNPRTQRWSDHFTWTVEGDRVIGLTPTGRATVVALKLNRTVRVTARRVWVAAGLHPPSEGVVGRCRDAVC